MLRSISFVTVPIKIKILMSYSLKSSLLSSNPKPQIIKETQISLCNPHLRRCCLFLILEREKGREREGNMDQLSPVLTPAGDLPANYV